MGEKTAFEDIYKKYWLELFKYASRIIKNEMICEEIIQEVFFSFWNKRNSLEISQSLKAYLFTAVKFQILKYIRTEKLYAQYAASYSAFQQCPVDNSNEESIRANDLKNKIESEVAKLPEKCRQIFMLSRNEHQSIKNISDLLQISHKTVENQLTKALKHLRSSLGEFLVLSVSVIINL